MHYLPRYYVEKHWLPSIGEKLDKIHYREPPPGTGHAECEPNAEYCEVHYDKVNPHQDPLGHLIEDSPEILVGLGAAALAGKAVYARRKNIDEAFLAALGTGSISYIIAKFIKSSRVRTAIREEPMKLAQYLRGEKDNYEPVVAGI